MSVPYWLKTYLSDSEREAIKSAVKKAETKTSGELVPMVVRRSSTVGHVPLALLLLFALIFFIFDIDDLQTEWFDLPHWILICGDLLILTILVRLISPLSFVERLLTPKGDQSLQVEQRAIQEFYAHKLDQTDEATGILIMVSLMERRAVVLGDRSISEKLSPEVWQNVVDRLISGIKSKDLQQGFVDAIAMSGDLLEKSFPIKPGDINELRNDLIIKE